MKTARILLVLGLLSSCSSCKTVDLPPPVAEAGACVGSGAIQLLDDVASALISNGWEAALAELATRFGGRAISCAVQEVGSQSFHAFQASGDGLEHLKAQRASAWLRVHPVQ